MGGRGVGGKSGAWGAGWQIREAARAIRPFLHACLGSQVADTFGRGSLLTCMLGWCSAPSWMTSRTRSSGAPSPIIFWPCAQRVSGETTPMKNAGAHKVCAASRYRAASRKPRRPVKINQVKGQSALGGPALPRPHTPRLTGAHPRPPTHLLPADAHPALDDEY